jgi:glycosyltransferase involved in cell wall biosynthesis
VFCSTIIPTVGRATLSKAVSSVLAQACYQEDLEVIVVNDSGSRLPPSEWQHVPKVQVIDTYRHERSVARNTGAALATGRYLHFLDDDDWLLPDAMSHLRRLSERSDASWLYGASRLVDRKGQTLITLPSVAEDDVFLKSMCGEWIPLQASLIRADAFFAVGGFNTLINGPEDIDLLRRLALTERVARTEEIVACISWGREGSTTDWARHSQQSRWAKELILQQAETFQRLRLLAHGPQWHGGLVRIYLASAMWNLQHKRLFSALARAALALRALLNAGAATLFSREFYRSIFATYQGEAFLAGFREAADGA